MAKEKEEKVPVCDQCREPFQLKAWGHNAYCAGCYKYAVKQTARMAAARREAIAAGADIRMTDEQAQRDAEAMKLHPTL